jgi:hypothetical protein
MNESDVERFWSKVKKTDTCWEWVGTLHVSNYGCFKVGGRVLKSHRVAYELLIGPIPPGLVIDHLCRNTRCVNPAHLEPVTNAENLHRVPPRTHCKHGHPFNEANTYVLNGTKFCRVCSNKRSKAYQASLLVVSTEKICENST